MNNCASPPNSFVEAVGHFWVSLAAIAHCLVVIRQSNNHFAGIWTAIELVSGSGQGSPLFYCGFHGSSLSTQSESSELRTEIHQAGPLPV